MGLGSDTKPPFPAAPAGAGGEGVAAGPPRVPTVLAGPAGSTRKEQ